MHHNYEAFKTSVLDAYAKLNEHNDVTYSDIRMWSSIIAQGLTSNDANNYVKHRAQLNCLSLVTAIALGDTQTVEHFDATYAAQLPAIGIKPDMQLNTFCTHIGYIIADACAFVTNHHRYMQLFNQRADADDVKYFNDQLDATIDAHDNAIPPANDMVGNVITVDNDSALLKEVDNKYNVTISADNASMSERDAATQPNEFDKLPHNYVSGDLLNTNN